MIKTETLRIRRFERCDSAKPEDGLEAGDYFYVVKSDDPSRRGQNYNLKTYKIEGNTEDKHPNEIIGYWSEKLNRFVHEKGNLLGVLYTRNKNRTFEYIEEGETPATHNSPSKKYHKLKDTGCGYIYTHYGELPDSTWCVGEVRKVVLKVNGNSLEITVEKKTENRPISSAMQTFKEENWISPTQLFSLLHEEENYERLFEQVYTEAVNERVCRPEQFIKNIKLCHSPWIFGYIKYILSQYLRSIKSNYKLIQELTSLVIKIEKLICFSPDFMEQLGVADRLECADKASQVIRRAQALNKAAGLLENPVCAVSLFNEMAESLKSLGQILEDPETNTQAFIEAIRMNSQELVKNYPLSVIELTNALFFSHKLSGEQQTDILRPMKNELLLRSADLPEETIVILGTMLLLLNENQAIEEAKSNAILYLVLLKICTICEKQQKSKAISSLIRALKTGIIPSEIITWDNFNKMVSAAKIDSFSMVINNLTESLEYNPSCYEMLTEDLEEEVTKNDKTRTLCRSILLSVADLCLDNIDASAEDKIDILMFAISICSKNNDQTAVLRYRSILDDYSNLLAIEEAKKASEKAEAEKQKIQAAIKLRQEQVSKDWDQLYRMAVSLKASYSTLQAIHLNKEGVLHEVEKEVRQEFASGDIDVDPKGLEEIEQTIPSTQNDNIVAFNFGINHRFDLYQFCQKYPMDRKKDHTSFLKAGNTICIFLSRSFAAGLDISKKKEYDIAVPDFNPEIGVSGISAEILSSKDEEILIFRKEDKDTASYFDIAVCIGEELVLADKHSPARLRLKFKSLKRF